MSETSRSPIDAGVTHALADAALPEWIMWMPAGDHQILASKRGKPIRLRMQVDAGTAATMQRTLREYLAEGRQRPFLDFDHERKAASGWPLEFAWRESPEPGVWCRVDWSEAGKAAITGRSYRSFSPSFYEASKNPSRVEGAPLCMGSLLNNPAFEDITPIWSGRGDQAAHQTDTHTHTMPITESELAALRARNTELEGKVTELQAAAADEEREAAIEAAKHENDTLKAELSKLKEAVEARSKRDADAVVASAVARGIIAPKDEAVQTKWRDLILKDPANADLLHKQPSRSPVDSGRITRPKVEVVQPDINDCLRGYQSAKSPVDAGHIYRREFKAILDKGERIPFERFPVDAANVLGTVAGNLIAQRTLDLMVSRRPVLQNVLTDFSDQQARKGQTVYTRAVGIPTINDFGTGATDTADTDYSVTLSAHKESHYAFTAAEYLSTNRNLVEEHAEALAMGLGNHLVDAVAALITDAFTSETTGAASGKDFSALTTAAKALNVAGAPDANRAMWINGDFAEALSNDELIMEYLGGDNRSAYGHWVNIKGFAHVWEFPALPANAVNLIGFAFHRNALVLATRVADNPERLAGAGYAGVLQVITDPVTGLSVLSDRWITQATRAVNTRLDVLYGCARGAVTAGHKFVSA